MHGRDEGSEMLKRRYPLQDTPCKTPLARYPLQDLFLDERLILK